MRRKRTAALRRPIPDCEMSDASLRANASVESAIAYVGLGANLGAAAATIESATLALDHIDSTRVVRSSSLYRSAPVGAEGPDYLNSVVELRTTLAPPALLAELQRIEAAHGRARTYRNAPRTLDLDLLLYADQTLETDALTVPHPRLHERAFVLLPLAEIAPGLVVPGRGAVTDLLRRAADQRIDRLDR